jgi:hypothetical protein
VPSIYTKLTPTKRRLFGYSRLWLAPDHILLLTSTQFAEEYKRFALSEIQAIVVTESPSRIIPQVIVGMLGLVLMALWFDGNFGWQRWLFAIIGAVLLLWAIIDIARGPRCRCTLRTRVTKQVLEPVSRMRIARKFLGILRPMIEAVQGSLPDQFGAVESPAAAWEPPPPEIVSSPGYLPEVVFGLFLTNAALIYAAAHSTKVAEISGVLLNLLTAEFILILVALVRRWGRDTRIVIYVIMALAIIGVGFDLKNLGSQFFGWYINVMDKAKNGDKSPTPLNLYPAMGSATIAYSWRIAAGVAGLAAAFWERRRPPL